MQNQKRIHFKTLPTTIDFHRCDLPEHVDQSAKPEAVAAAASLNTNLRLQPAIATLIAGVGFLHPHVPRSRQQSEPYVYNIIDIYKCRSCFCFLVRLLVFLS